MILYTELLAKGVNVACFFVFFYSRMFQIQNECTWDVMVFLSFSDIFNTGNVIESKSETGTERQWDRKTNKERKVKMELVSDQEIHPPKKKEFNKKTHAHEISKVI